MVPRVPKVWFGWVPMVLVLGVSLSANDWPHWRGPTASGVAAPSPLPSTWSSTENVAWQAPLQGAGVSSPIVSGNRVFVTSQVGDGRRQGGNHPTLAQGVDPATAGESTLARRAGAPASTFVVEAFDRATGKRSWIHEIAAEGELPPVHDKHNLASASPVTDGERVYAWFGTGQIVALDVNGKPLWSKHLGQEYGAFDINWGHASSPVLFEDSIILLLLSLAGVVQRSTARSQLERTESTASRCRARWIVRPHEVNRLPDSRLDGRQRHPVSEPRLSLQPVHGDQARRPRRHYETNVVWRVADRRPVRVVAGALPGRDLHEHRQRHPVGVRCEQRQRLWQERVGGTFSASPIAGDGKIYFVSEGGETIVVKAGRTFEIVSRNKLDGHFVASPAAGGGKVFLRADDRLRSPSASEVA